jgi:hypothetical protein
MDGGMMQFQNKRLNEIVANEIVANEIVAGFWLTPACLIIYRRITHHVPHGIMRGTYKVEKR